MKKILVICAAVLISSVVLALGMGNIMKSERTVTVRGLAEREVDADMAVWKLSFSVGSNNLKQLQEAILNDTETIKAFLESHDLTSADYTVKSPEITDATVSMYSNPENRSFDYVAKQTILIRSSNVTAVKNAAQDTISLIGKGVSVSSDWDAKVDIISTDLMKLSQK